MQVYVDPAGQGRLILGQITFRYPKEFFTAQIPPEGVPHKHMCGTSAQLHNIREIVLDWDVGLISGKGQQIKSKLVGKKERKQA